MFFFAAIEDTQIHSFIILLESASPHTYLVAVGLIPHAAATCHWKRVNFSPPHFVTNEISHLDVSPADRTNPPVSDTVLQTYFAEGMVIRAFTWIVQNIKTNCTNEINFWLN
jgi:hypothetical protein